MPACGPGRREEGPMTQVADDAALAAARGRWSWLGAWGSRRSVSFPELVHIHHLWRDALESEDERFLDVNSRYRAARAAFEREHGRIVSEYWCWRFPSAVVLTAKPASGPVRFVKGPSLFFHRASDWATKGEPEIAAQMHRCDELAARGTQVLTGVRKRICIQLVMASASHLLSLVDARERDDSGTAREEHAEANKKKIAAAIEQERRCLDEAEAYYHDAATGQAQVVYFAGMAIVMLLFGLFALLGTLLGWLWTSLPGIEDGEFYGCLAAGAVGAVVSVIQRINSGRFELEYDVGRRYVCFLGGLRPTIGAVFGLALYFAINSEILKLFDLPNEGTGRLFALLVIAFLGGFSERWAQDSLTALAPTGAASKTPASEPKRTRRRHA
jgi:hypothetical protein